MQAKKDQDWTDDAAFWDEAWADMNTRLDTEPRHRKYGFGWLAFYLVFAGVIALTVFMAVHVLLEEDPSLARPAPSGPEVVLTEPDNAARIAPGAQTTVSGEEALDEALNVPPATTETAISTVSDKAVKKPESTAKSRFATDLSPAHPDAQQDQPKDEIPGIETTEDTPARTTNASTETFHPDQVVAQRNNIAASPEIPPLAMLITNADRQQALPTVTKQPLRYRNPITIDAAYTGSIYNVQPGFLVGAGYSIKTGRKLSFPLSLRFRFDELSVKKSPLDAVVESDISTGSPTTGNGSFVLVPRSVSSSALELGAGISWDAAPRLHLVSGLTAAYQLEGLIHFEGEPSSSFTGQLASGEYQNLYSLDFDRSADLLDALTQGGVAPDFNRWAFRAQLGVAYDLTPRLGANLKLTRLLAQIDRAAIIEVQNSQLELGVSYRFR